MAGNDKFVLGEIVPNDFVPGSYTKSYTFYQMSDNEQKDFKGKMRDIGSIQSDITNCEEVIKNFENSRPSKKPTPADVKAYDDVKKDLEMFKGQLVDAQAALTTFLNGLPGDKMKVELNQSGDMGMNAWAKSLGVYNLQAYSVGSEMTRTQFENLVTLAKSETVVKGAVEDARRNNPDMKIATTQPPITFTTTRTGSSWVEYVPPSQNVAATKKAKVPQQ